MQPDFNVSVLRIIDAAANRASEGLRVVEDYCRLHLQDQWLSSTAKKLRHDLVQALAPIEPKRLLRSRNTEGDVGTRVEVESEYLRTDQQQIVGANFARVQQSLRTIEEYSKIVDSNIARHVESIRYASYTLQQAIANATHSCRDLAGARLYVLTDLRGSPPKFEALVDELIRAEVDLIQLRDKSATDRQLVMAGRLLNERTRNTGTRWIMNDRPDLAVLADADGVHVGQDDLPVADVRAIVGPEKMIGISTHNIEQARAAVMASATYIGVGPVFRSSTKSFETQVTDTFLKQVVAEISLPAFAIGGIDERNLPDLIGLGIQRIAVSHCVISAESPTAKVAALKAMSSIFPRCNTACCPNG